MFERILIANRGEIACRVIATAKRLGILTVAVYSDADRDALHVQLADQAIHIGASPAALSYLDSERILKAARDSGAEAIHPGYGFLSENAEFARACEQANIVFIGPSAAAIDAMGSKARAKEIMADAGVPLVPGYHGSDQNDEILRKQAQSMGYPVLLKATAGGGGKGMRAVHAAHEFDEALAAARRESKASFADDRMLVEKLLQEPRHVEVQVFCDSHGNAIYLSERDCSIQRRHQKVVEEAPAPALPEELRRAMGAAAIEAAEAIDYRGAGTVEFLLDRDRRFYFMEMNTRLQVEHPVTEMVTGLDLVEWQLLIAAGQTLPLAQEDLRITGHAIEVRIYAEDPAADFTPSTGHINYLRTPTTSAQLRIDTGVVEGSEISPYYDPMIAKLIAYGDSREEARRRLSTALGEFHVAGVTNNIAYLKRIIDLPAFADVQLNTHFIDDHQAVLGEVRQADLRRKLSAAALVLLAQHQVHSQGRGNDHHSPWVDPLGWRMNAPASRTLEIVSSDEEFTLELMQVDDSLRLSLDQEQWKVRGRVTDDQLRFEMDGQRYSAKVAIAPSALNATHILFFADSEFHFSERQLLVGGSTAAAGDASFAAPMHGSVVALVVAPGTEVAAGDPVIVIEAMKMEQTLRAPVSGMVESFNCAPGDLVDRGLALVNFTAADA
ncbi:MAG: acetyl-CoA carboxylase biotin carboxylase subunit [Congregibacter sp.]